MALPLNFLQKAAHAALVKCEEGKYHGSMMIDSLSGDDNFFRRGDGVGQIIQNNSLKKPAPR